MPMLRHLLRLAACLLACCVSLVAAAQPRVQNTATLTYQAGGAMQSVVSNTVTIDVARPRNTAKLSFRLLPTGYQLTGLDCQTTPTLLGIAAPIDAATLAAAPPLAKIDIRQPLIMVLEAPGQNRDPTVREFALINADAGAEHRQVRLQETGPNSGVFAGGLPEQGNDPSPCALKLARGQSLQLGFEGDDDDMDAQASALVDPAGFVFDSTTGALVDGASVTLLNLDGTPATVFGDDGVSAYPSTVVTGATVTDASGRTYPPEPGRYRFPLNAPGQYILKVVPPPGYTAPSARDAAALASLRGADGQAFILNEASYGRVFTEIDGRDFMADVPIDPYPRATLLLTKTASAREASPGDAVQYILRVSNRGATPSAAAHLIDSLPTGLRYRRGSARGIGEPAVSNDGRQLDFALPAIAAGRSVELRYIVSVAPGAPVGEALNRAQVTGGATSNEAAASVRLHALLFTDALTVIGRVTEGDCDDPVSRRKGIAGVRLLLDDGTFVVTDRDGLYHLEGVRPGRHVVQLDTASIPTSHAPVACDRDTRQAGSAISRFVEGDGGAIKRVDFQLRPTGKVAAAADPLPIAVVDDATAAGNRDWLAGQQPGIAWLFPGTGYNPRAPVLRVAIKHLPGQRVALTVRGFPTDPLTFDTTDLAAGQGVAVSRWSGIPLVPGINHLSARVLDAAGTTIETLERDVVVSGAPARAVADPEHSRLVADGLTRPLIAVRITDAQGRPVRAGTLLSFKIDQPYVAAVEADLEQGRQLAGRERAAATAPVVGDDGLAFIALQPTTQSGAVHVVVTLTDDKTVRTSDIRAWLAASAKEWTVVGFGAGTLGYEMLSKHGRSLPKAERNRAVADGQLSFYAKGRIKGSWLLTVAYDTDRKADPDRGLLGTIDPDRYYTVYGDGTRQGYDAATQRKLYVRLERREAYALFGDVETGFTDTQLTRYSRTLSGVKAAYEGRRIRATGFAAQTETLAARDEIQGNGLSGPYRLSTRGIVPNSDKLRIEVRDRYRSELIVSSVQMTRHVDYDIDTELGTVRFREPVLSRDASLNPVFIVVDYEVEGGRSGKLAAAARVSAKLAGDRVEVGSSIIRDDTRGMPATIVGADVKAHLGRSTELRGEIAGGGRGGLDAGRAYLAEAEHHGSGIDVLAYVRQQDAGFGVGQQNLVDAGTRKIGIDGRFQITPRLSLTGTAWHQDMLTGPGKRLAGDARLEYRKDGSTLFVGGQFASDRGLDGGDRDSRLLTLGGSKALFGGKLTVAGQTQVAPGGDKSSVDFPVRHQLSLGYRVTPGIRLIGGYEIADGADYVAHTAQLGFDVAPWTGAKLASTLNQQAIGENGRRTFAQYGLSQSLPLGKHWTVDATLDASSTVRGRIPAGAVVNPLQPVAAGGFLGQDQTNGDFVAVTGGATYRQARWSWNGRLEYRDGSASTRWGVTTNMLRTLGEGKTIAAGLKAFRMEDKAGAVATSAQGDIAVALRPLDSRWSVLERFELRHQHADAGVSDANLLGIPASGGDAQLTTRVINNLAVNYRTGAEGGGHGLEVSVYYGAKLVAGRFGDERFDGYIDVTGFDLRQDLGRRVDVGIAGSVQHAWRDRVWSWSGGPSAGVSPGGNLWITAGYNIAGYRDRDFEDDRYTRAGPYLTLRAKFDQRTLGGAARAFLGHLGMN